MLRFAGVVLVCWSGVNAADWPGWRGSNRDGLSLETGLLRQWPANGPPLAWRAQGLGFGFSSISIVGDRIFTMGDRADGQYVLALSLTDGKQVWATKIGPVWDDDDTGGPRGTPTIDGDSVYVMGTEGELVCLDKGTGSIRWQKSMTRNYNGQMMSVWKYAESPLVDGDKVLFTTGNFDGMVIASDKRTGKDVWRANVSRIRTNGSNGAGYSSMVISEGVGVRQYVQLIGRGLIGIRAEDGKVLWSHNKVANDVANVATPVVRGDYVFASTAYGAGSVLLKLEKTADGVAAKEAYSLEPRVFQNHHGGFVLVGDFLYGGHGQNNGFPICIEFATGKVRWGGNIRPEGATGSAAVAYADGHLYFRYENGVMKLIEAAPEGFKETGSFQIPGVHRPSWSHPVILSGKLYVREQDALLVYNIRG